MVWQKKSWRNILSLSDLEQFFLKHNPLKVVLSTLKVSFNIVVYIKIASLTKQCIYAFLAKKPLKLKSKGHLRPVFFDRQLFFYKYLPINASSTLKSRFYKSRILTKSRFSPKKTRKKHFLTSSKCKSPRKYEKGIYEKFRACSGLYNLVLPNW